MEGSQLLPVDSVGPSSPPQPDWALGDKEDPLQRLTVWLRRLTHHLNSMAKKTPAWQQIAGLEMSVDCARRRLCHPSCPSASSSLCFSPFFLCCPTAWTQYPRLLPWPLVLSTNACSGGGTLPLRPSELCLLGPQRGSGGELWNSAGNLRIG